jgi:hypothetical protein
MTPGVSRFVAEENRVILRGDLATDVLFDTAYSGTPGFDEFSELFEIVKGAHLAKEDYYQGITVMALIRRRSDGRLFGYKHFVDISKHSKNSLHEANGDEHGFEYDESLEVDPGRHVAPDDVDDLNEVYVWLPVQPFTITGYRFLKVN